MFTDSVHRINSMPVHLSGFIFSVNVADCRLGKWHKEAHGTANKGKAHQRMVTRPRKLLNPELSNETYRCDHSNERSR